MRSLMCLQPSFFPHGRPQQLHLRQDAWAIGTTAEFGVFSLSFPPSRLFRNGPSKRVTLVYSAGSHLAPLYISTFSTCPPCPPLFVRLCPPGRPFFSSLFLFFLFLPFFPSPLFPPPTIQVTLLLLIFRFDRSPSLHTFRECAQQGNLSFPWDIIPPGDIFADRPPSSPLANRT